LAQQSTSVSITYRNCGAPRYGIGIDLLTRNVQSLYDCVNNYFHGFNWLGAGLCRI